MENIGFGDKDFTLAVYIANKPNMHEYRDIADVIPLVEGEINVINQACGNGWRKVFNVYAKLLYALEIRHFPYSEKALTWQGYRDKYLLQAKSEIALLFSAPQLNPSKEVMHIICGKGHAKDLINKGDIIANLVWLDDEFAIDVTNRLFVCPYFDYRQLSNIKIARLADLLLSIKTN